MRRNSILTVDTGGLVSIEQKDATVYEINQVHHFHSPPAGAAAQAKIPFSFTWEIFTVRHSSFTFDMSPQSSPSKPEITHQSYSNYLFFP
jgi:hypothetical protein